MTKYSLNLLGEESHICLVKDCLFMTYVPRFLSS